MINDVKLTLEATAAASMARWLDGRRLAGWMDGWLAARLVAGCWLLAARPVRTAWLGWLPLLPSKK